MIEGLKFDVSAEEMHNHLYEREAHHLERTRFYKEQVKSLEGGGAEAMTNYSGGDPIRALRDKATEHLRKASLCRFLLSHVVKGETYRLNESELSKLEFIDGKGWY